MKSINRQLLVLEGLFFICVFQIAHSQAATVRVPQDHGTIQAAIDTAGSGDTVLIADGVYVGPGNVNIDFGGKMITVMSENGPDACIVDCQGIEGARGFVFESCERDESLLLGITIKNGNFINEYGNGNGGAILCDGASPTIENCIIENCRAELYGGGIYCIRASPVISGCVFTGNSAKEGAGILCNVSGYPRISDCRFADSVSENSSAICVYNNAFPEISECEISGTVGSGIWINTASALITGCTIFDNSESGIAVSSSTETVISNCILRGNQNQSGLWCYRNADITVYNCLMVGNRGFGGVSCSDSSPKIVNCIIADNINGGINCFAGQNTPAIPTSPTFVNCIVWGNSGEGVQVYSPESPIILYSDLQEYASPPNGDSILDAYPGGGTNISQYPGFTNGYALSASSVCRGRGRNSDNPTASDLAGNVRISGGAIDMGAYEYGAPPAGDPPPTAPSNVIFVRPGASGNGDSWENAAGLQDALDRVPGGSEIWAAKGVYKPSSRTVPAESRSATFILKNCIAVYGGFSGSETKRSDRDWQRNITVLSGDIDDDDIVGLGGISTSVNGANAYHVVTGGTDNDRTAVMDGFVITGGNADGEGADGQGGGMLNWRCAPTVRNCTFDGNQAVYGGAMMNSQSSPDVVGCTFRNNTSLTDTGGGGAMNNWDGSSPLVSACQFLKNHAVAQGGAIINQNSSLPRISDTSFSGNSTANQGGAILNVDVDPTISNCLFSKNSGRWGGALMNVRSSPTVSGCDFSENSTINDGNGGAIDNDDASSPVITDCSFSGNSAQMQGGAVINLSGSDAVISNCTFTGNTASNGAGIFNVYNSSPEIQNCVFTANSATIQGGGIVNINGVAAVISDSTFQNNTAENGGGIFNDENSTSEVVRCTFTGNTAGYMGGGLVSIGGGVPDIRQSSFIGNKAADGGGVLVSDGSLSISESVFRENSVSNVGGGLCSRRNSASTVVSCSFEGNETPSDGGGIYCESSILDIVNTVFSGNSAGIDGGAMYNWKAGTEIHVINCTFAANSASLGAGIYAGEFGDTDVVNSILWGNNTEDIVNDGGVAAISYSLLQQGWSGSGSDNKIQNPLFARMPVIGGTSSDYGNLRLDACSPAVGTGDNSAVSGISMDRDGNIRIVGGTVDMGAYENSGGVCDSPSDPYLNSRMVFVKFLYDDFSNRIMDTLKWAPGIVGDAETETYEIADENALLTTEGDGKQVVRMTALQHTDSPYMEAAVTVKSGSFISGNKSRARLSGLFYNDTYEASETGNGYEGDVYATISLSHFGDIGLKVRYMVGRFPTPDVAVEDVLADDLFSTSVDFDTLYRLSIHLRGDNLVFTCVDTSTSVVEQKTFSISTPVWPSKQHAEQRKLMARIDSGSTGKLIATFDDVYVGQYVFADVNGDDTVDLADVITVLKILSGHQSVSADLSADISGDGRIGIEEGVFLLRTLSEN